MHICLGVCGIGKGHSSRQLLLARHLASRGHTISVVGYGEAIPFFHEQNIFVHEVWVPFIPEIETGLSFRKTIFRNYRDFIPGILKNISVFFHLIWKGYPKVFVSDYEPVTARLAYLMKRPLVLLGQQSKFRHWSFPSIGNFNTTAERTRLSLFFPKFEKSFVVSFHDLPKLSEERIQVIPPFVQNEIKNMKRCNSKDIVVYFSDLFGTTISQSLSDFCQIAREFREYNFIIYVKDKAGTTDIENIAFKICNRDSFIADMMKSYAIISTAGFTLISEAIYLEKPIFCVPLPTYDQHFCAKYVSDCEIGVGHEIITQENLGFFIKNVERFREKMHHMLVNFGDTHPLDTVVQFIENI